MALSIAHIGFLTPGNYPDNDPAAGLEETLKLFEAGEALGFDSAWVRQRHLEHGVSSAPVFLAAASQRTRRIELGSAVIQLGYESPFRLAEDLSMADSLAGGRLNVGVSAGPPLHAELVAPLVFDGDWRSFDFSYGRVERLLDSLSGHYLGDGETYVLSPGNRQRARLQPFAPGLRDRVWYGGGSLRSYEWTGSKGLNLMIGSLTSGDVSDRFEEAQLAQLRAYRAALPPGRTPRVAAGRVIVPTDSADARTRARYATYAASRHERTLSPQGPRRTLFSRDLVGSSDEIIARLQADPVLSEVQELRLELPYEFALEEYLQIITDFVEKIAPQIGWQRRTGAEHPDPRSFRDPAIRDAERGRFAP
ncbi:Flavin-dependent oxidoreductase, luciferase family (includes alkanesulfonate monooxygenase SsuD and methylene tetrahydromethanopterin reductase) [Rhizobium sp. RU35A]|uniref:LLM class flavin-dependent oxidoreductase n=1 Tax=Rhizobium straminoryzae TaxID=1387186 RepID=A0A549TH91_9HYPH|nr:MULTISPECIES: LLM class flavin-dependent oxidoreductase [Rhizobium]TRL42289.1 LLM class flavin-dependent oxidoreductase [Rhizobium straminoryzae]SIQ96729.1 Flavin-dependent oxidoreductase, luciferase family (includes alkanesulfonate monooxygenase SsuD and methylene tetrahydromethanopterin reductase) [Rhizobium sp. RU35A]